MKSKNIKLTKNWTNAMIELWLDITTKNEIQLKKAMKDFKIC